MSRVRRDPRRWLSALRAPEWGLSAGILVVVGLIYLLDSSHAFFGPDTLQTLVHYTALYGVLAIGAAVVIIAGGIDLSVGSVVALSSVVSAKLVMEWLPDLGMGTAASRSAVVAAIALTLLMGLVIGLLHAIMINRLQLPPFIATLATLAGLRSLATILSDNRTIDVASEPYNMLILGSKARYAVPIFAAVACSASLMMGTTILGRHLYALGGNEVAARLSGLPTRRLKTVAYGLSGMLAALAGILFTGKTGQGDSGMGVAFELYAITAAVVGGCSLAGGVGSIRGTVLGLVLIQILISGTGLVVRDIDLARFGLAGRLHLEATQVEGLVLGTVIVLAVAFNQRFRNRT